MSLIPSDPVVEVPYSLPEAYDVLRERLVSEPHNGKVLSRIRIPVDIAVPLDWLAAQSIPNTFYWHPRNASAAVAGAGIARKYEGTEALSDAITFLENIPESDDVPRFFGGFPFPGNGDSPEWQSFGAGRFVLPRFELHVGDNGGCIILNVLDDDDTEGVLGEINKLNLLDSPSSWTIPDAVECSTIPELSAWKSGVVHALSEFESGSLDKVVLARKTTLEFEERIDPVGLLIELQHRTPACTHFLFQGEVGTTFIGATPERLFRLDNNWLYTEAIAGTRRRGTTEIEDSRLADQLLSDPKERYEHELVRDYIVQALGPLALGIEAGKTDILRLATKRHLYTPIAAILRPEVNAADVLAALHPTPAVAGSPTARAIEHIHATEPFDRGWYAGPIGWISAGAAEFFVAIRSGLIRTDATGSILNLYSGAGIVPGSDPRSEWEEVETKLSDFLRVISPAS